MAFAVDLAPFFGSESASDVRVCITCPFTATTDTRPASPAQKRVDLAPSAATDVGSGGGAPAAAADAPAGDAEHNSPRHQQQRRTVREIPGHRLLLQAASEWAHCALADNWREEAEPVSVNSLGSGASNQVLFRCSRWRPGIRTHLHNDALTTNPTQTPSPPTHPIHPLHTTQGAPPTLEIRCDCESEAAAAELLLRTMYHTADLTAPLRGASQAMLLQVRRACCALCVAFCWVGWVGVVCCTFNTSRQPRNPHTNNPHQANQPPTTTTTTTNNNNDPTGLAAG